MAAGGRDPADAWLIQSPSTGGSVFKEFKAFAMRGNVLDLAIGVIIGVAFGAIVTSLVNDIIMPPIGMAAGGLDFKDLFVSLNGQSYPSLDAAKKAGAPVIAYGNFLNTVINFLIVAFAIFLLVKQVNRFTGPAAVTTKDCPFCLSAIPIGAKRCPHCISDLTVASRA
jgi:large conductance mechanosensitive channel